ncbi:MAG: AroM family protein [Trueperaceae bacterium]
MTTIGFATIGQSPRDDVVPYLVERLGAPVRVLERGVMDGMDAAQLAALDRGDDGLHMVTKLTNGGSARIAYELAVPRMQAEVDALVADGADLVVILCGADWSALTAKVPIVNPGKLFPNVVEALSAGSRLGVVKPAAHQIAPTEKQYRGLGLDAVVTSAFPYDGMADVAARAAGRQLREAGAEIVWMTCVGMNESMRSAMREELDVPVILARSLLARVIGELVA